MPEDKLRYTQYTKPTVTSINAYENIVDTGLSLKVITFNSSGVIKGNITTKPIKAASIKADKIQEELSKKKEGIFQEKGKAEEKLKDLQAEREELLPKIPSDQIKLYNQISKTKNGIVLSPVTEEFCSMCHMRVRPQMVNELIAGTQIITCENCGRILYYTKKKD